MADVCRLWDKLNDGSGPPPAQPPWQPPSPHPTHAAYTVASPPPSTSRKPWEGTLRETALPQGRQRSPPRGTTPLSPVRIQPLHSTVTTASARSLSKPHLPSSNTAGSLSRRQAAGMSQQAQHADRGSEAPEWTPKAPTINRGTSVQPWQQHSIAAWPNEVPSEGRAEGRTQGQATGPNKPGVGQNASNLSALRGSASPRPKYLCLPEAESYEAFSLLAGAFRHWRGHAKAEQESRCISLQYTTSNALRVLYRTQVNCQCTSLTCCLTAS